MYRVNAIISLKEKIKQWMNKFCDISKSLKELLNHFCTFQENMINITVLKSIINQMKPPVISNIRRKFIDLFIFWIIKKNEKLFVLDPNYSPKSNYLDQILEILQNKNNSNEVKSKIDFVLKEKGKNSSITRFPMKIKNYLIDDCISYLNFYKGKCSQVIHIGKEGFKFYNLPEITKNDKINDTYHIFSESKNKKDYTEIKINSNNENIAEKDSMIDIEFVLKFLFESNYAYKPDDTNILNILSNINNEKKDTFDTIIDSISQSFSNAVKSLENNSNMPKKNIMEDQLFNQEEQEYLNKALKDFEAQIAYIKALIIGLKGKEKDISEYKSSINIINKELISLVIKECSFDDDYFYALDQQETGTIVLLYFQYKFIKLKNLYDLLEEACRNYFEQLDKSKSHIEEEIVKLKNETEMLKEKVRIDNIIPSGRNIFLQWKKKKKNEFYNYNFTSFVNQLKLALRGVSSFKIDNDVIVDQITSCWLIKNKLDTYVLE